MRADLFSVKLSSSLMLSYLSSLPWSIFRKVSLLSRSFPPDLQLSRKREPFRIQPRPDTFVPLASSRPFVVLLPWVKLVLPRQRPWPLGNVQPRSWLFAFNRLPDILDIKAKKSYYTGIDSGFLHKRQTSGHSHWRLDLDLTCCFGASDTSFLSLLHFS